MISDNTIISEGNVSYIRSKKFKELKFIESSGTQYIDTGYKPNGNTKIDITYWTSNSSSTCIGAVDDGWSTAGFGIWSDAYKFGNSKATYSSNKGVATWNYLYKIREVMDSSGIVKNDVSCTTVITPNTYSCNDTLTLFALKRSGFMTDFAVMKLYSCKIYDNGKLVRDFVPFLNDTEIGLYDTAEQKFYGSKGTENFIAGPVADLDSDYQLIDYLHDDPVSDTSWLTLDIKPTSSAKVWIDFKINDIYDLNSGAAIFGIREAASTIAKKKFAFLLKQNASDKSVGNFRFDWGTQSITDSKQSNSFDRYQITIDEQELRYPDSRGLVPTKNTFSSNYNLGVFAYPTPNAKTYSISNMNLYSFEYYDDTMNRFYVPCRKKSTGTYGLFELYTRTYVEGSSEFSGGSDVNSESDFVIDSKKNANVNTLKRYFDLSVLVDNGIGENVINLKNIDHVIKKID